MRRWLQHLNQTFVRPRRPHSSRLAPFRPSLEILEVRELLDGSGMSPAALQQRFLGQVYQDLLGRSLDPTGQAYFSNFNGQDPTARDQVTGAITSSPEFRAHLVENLYTQLLGRPADPDGLNYFVSL